MNKFHLSTTYMAKQNTEGNMLTWHQEGNVSH